MIYLDNGATSYPKPSGVISAGVSALKKYSFNSGRGGYKQSVLSAERIFSVRQKIADMFGFEAQNVAFTKNCTEALNIAIKGSVKRGDRIIISSLEHNSVWRTVNKLRDEGIAEYDIADFDFDEDICVSNFERLIQPNTSLIVCMSASNVFGVLFPISKIGALAKKHSIRFVVDGAQSAGLIPLNAQNDNIDILCAPGHKCLLGSMGTGFIAVKEGVTLNTLLEGGTGSNSVNPKQPDFLPDRLEAGTLNNPGIISLGAGIDFINKNGMENLYRHELSSAQRLYDYLSTVKNASLYCPKPKYNCSAPIVSFNYKDYSSEKTASLLAENGIAVRGGLHCAPLAHRHFSTIERGTVRLCPSCFTTAYECEVFLNTLKKL